MGRDVGRLGGGTCYVIAEAGLDGQGLEGHGAADGCLCRERPFLKVLLVRVDYMKI